MAEVTPARTLIDQAETQFRASLNENTMTRLAAANGFIQRYVAIEHNWKVNGAVAQAVSINAVDGVLFCFSNIRIIGYSITLGNTGSSSSLIVDVREIDTAGVDQGSIFNTPPQIDNTATNNSSSGDEYFLDVQNQVASGGGGHTQADFAKREFTPGTTLEFQVTQSQPEARNLNFKLLYIPL